MKKKSPFEKWHEKYFGVLSVLSQNPNEIQTDYKTIHVNDAFNAGRRAERKRLKPKFYIKDGVYIPVKAERNVKAETKAHFTKLERPHEKR